MECDHLGAKVIWSGVLLKAVPIPSLASRVNAKNPKRLRRRRKTNSAQGNTLG